MPKLNKTITTNVLEQVKTVLLVAFVVGIAGFFYGIQYQKQSVVTVANKVVVQTSPVAEVKK